MQDHSFNVLTQVSRDMNGFEYESDDYNKCVEAMEKNGFGGNG